MADFKYRLCICATVLIVILCTFVFYSNKHKTEFDITAIIPSVSFNGKLSGADTKNDIQSSQNYIRKYFSNENELLEAHWLKLIKHYIPLPLESGYGSHKLALLAASILTSQTGGPSMEMGCGYHSTLLLHQILVNEQKRYLLSTDTDQEWLQRFENNMTSNLHEFRHIKQTSDWDEIGNDRSRWSIIFVDHKPGERRVVDIIRLENVTDLMIIHDTETASYNYEQGLSRYPYRYRYKYLGTNTDVVSKSNHTLFEAVRYLLELTIKMQIPIRKEK